MSKPAQPEVLGQIEVGTRPMWLFADGTILPVVSGGSDVPPAPVPTATPPAPVATPPAPAPTATPPADKTFTQAEVDALMAREKDQGRSAAEKAIAEQLGCTPEEAKAVLDAHRETERKAMTEAEKAQADAAKARTEAETLAADAKADRHAAAVERTLSRAGVDEATLTKVSRLVEVEVGADAAAIETAVTALKTEMPALFGTAPAPTPTPGLPSSTPGTPPAQQNGTDAFTAAMLRGQEAAKQRSPMGAVSVPG